MIFQNFFRLVVSAVLFIFLFGTGFVNAAVDDSVLLPKLVDFQAASSPDGKPVYVEIGLVEQQFRKASPKMQRFYSNPGMPTVLVPSDAWVKELLKTSQSFFRQLRVKWHAESWDCDNYSMFISAGVTLKLWGAGYTNTRCGLGWMVVDGKHDWAGIGPGRHALMFAVTSEGINVIEPQTGAIVKLDRYPNKEYIMKVVLL